MPDTNKRKRSTSALKRMKERYIDAPEESHPYRLYPPIKDRTSDLGKVLDGKNFIRILTQLDKNQFICMQYYIYCESDFWICGDALIYNQNPDKKILCQVYCSKTRKQCCAYEEESHEFITLCPQCRNPVLMIKNTGFKCKHCNYIVYHNQIKNMPYLKLPCAYCPIEIGWGKVIQLGEKHYINFLQLTEEQQKEVIQKQLEEAEKESDNG